MEESLVLDLLFFIPNTNYATALTHPILFQDPNHFHTSALILFDSTKDTSYATAVNHSIKCLEKKPKP